MPAGTETILVVEDDADVRSYVTASLELLGYNVIEAQDGRDVMALLERKLEIDLLFSDIVMPGSMNGIDIADEVRKHYPGIKVLFTSGYAQGTSILHGPQDEAIELLQKPYSRETLAQTIRCVLDGAPA